MMGSLELEAQEEREHGFWQQEPSVLQEVSLGAGYWCLFRIIYSGAGA